ncbi:SCO family protein [Paracoccus suum]|uniref:SCO family protein n=1 Tax=Paracoccus suum TaxID=2259340 RepID=UPI001F54232D|nr:SCO family protein [Paracoccus suum]
MTKSRRIIIAATIAALALLGIGAWALGQRAGGDRFAGCTQGAAGGGMESFGGPFTLTDENGKRVTDREVFTKPTLLYFGYTFCPDVCPMDGARNAQAVDLLKEAGHDVGTVFVTVDPKRDTPEALRDFTDALHPNMLGLTGSPEEIAAVNKQWRNYFKAHDDGDPYYLVDHMTNTFLVLPDAGTVEFFTREVTPEDMASRVACFVKADRKI